MHTRNIEKKRFCLRLIVAVLYALLSAPPAEITAAMVLFSFRYIKMHPPMKIAGTMKMLVVSFP